MAINRFDQPAQAKFVDTYVPVPFEEMGKMLQARQQRLDQNLSALDEAKANADNLNAIPNSRDALYISGVRDKLHNISMEYVDKDLSDPEIYRELNRKIRSSVDPSRIRRAQESFAGYSNYQKVLATQVAKGQVADPKLLQNFQDYDTETAGVYAGLPREYVDVDSAVTDFFKNVEPESFGLFDVEGRPEFVEAREGVSTNKLMSYARKNAEDFMNTSAGRYILDVAKANGDDRDGKAIIQDYLETKAPAFKTSQSRYMSSGIDNGGGGPDNPSSIPATDDGPLTPTGDITGKERHVKKRIPEIEDKIPSLYSSKSDVNKAAIKSINEQISELESEYTEKISKAKNSKEKHNLILELPRKRQELYQKYLEEKKTFNKDKSINIDSEEDKLMFEAYSNSASQYLGLDKETFDRLPDNKKLDILDEYVAYRHTRDKYPEVVSYLQSGTPEEMKALKIQNEALQNYVFDNRPVYFPEKGKDQQITSMSELVDMYPIKSDDGYTYHNVGRTTDIPNPEFAYANQIQIRSKKTDELVATVFMGGSKEEKFDRINSIDNMIATELSYSDLPFGSFQIGQTEIKWREIEHKTLPSAYVIEIDDDNFNFPEIPVQNIAGVRQFLHSVGIY